MAAAARSQIEAANCLESRSLDFGYCYNFSFFRGAKVNYVSPVLGLTALHVALLNGSADMIDTLVEMGGRLENICLWDYGAKEIASKAGNTEAVLYLERMEKQKKSGAHRLVFQKSQIGNQIMSL